MLGMMAANPRVAWTDSVGDQASLCQQNFSLNGRDVIVLR